MKQNHTEATTTSLKLLQSQLQQCRLCDQKNIATHIAALNNRLKSNQPIDQSLQKLEQSIKRSKDIVNSLENSVPKVRFPEQLPIAKRIDDISEAISKHQVVIIAGETGSGKTTQIPKICLTLGRGRLGLIGHTQPRRLAARTVSSRIAEELKVTLGEQVGYKIRFDDVSSDKANLLVMTDGMLLAEMSADPLLLAYDTLIIDEAHERSLNIDFLLGYLHQLLDKRPELKLIITSATIDPARFSKHFNNAPIIEVSGRTYPVEVRYRPLLVTLENTDEGQSVEEIVREPLQAMAEAVAELIDYGSGDILIFLPGEREIRDAAGFLRKRFLNQLDVFPLYSRLSKKEQDKIFKSHTKRRIVLATNVAETSLTVPGIRYVIDTGVARISRYNQKTKVQQLPIEAISQASANQRKGRCGRLEDGICIRLYAEEDFNLRKEFTEAEIHRTNLASVILKMKQMRLGNIQQFPFVEPPEEKRISDGFRLLQNLQAINSKKELTHIGKQIARLPLDPRFGKMLYTAAQYHCLKELLIIVSALSVQDIRERPLEKRQQADEFHRRFNSVNSDFISILNLWQYCHHLRQDLSSSAFRRQLAKQFLSFVRLRDWTETYRQLSSLCKQSGMKINQLPSDYASVHKSIISGLPDQLGNKSPDGDYLGARNSRFLVTKQSAVINKTRDDSLQQIFDTNTLKSTQKQTKVSLPSGQWIVAAELVETQKIYARQAAVIDTDWVVEVVSPLIKKRYYDPFWSLKSGACKAYLQQSIFGLILETKKLVNYETVDKEYCRQLFLKEGLVKRQLKTKIPEIINFWQACDEVIQQEDKVRRRDRLLDSESIVELLDNRLPKSIVSIGQLNKWYKKANLEQRSRLNISAEKLLRNDVSEMPELPKYWLLNDIKLPIEYKFEPGSEDDGMTVTLPLAILQGLDNSDFEYLIPALLRDKIIALLKGLAKKLRKNFVPVPNFADSILARIEEQKNALGEKQYSEKLLPAICRHLKQITGVSLSISELEAVELPPQLKVNFKLIDEAGKVLCKARDITLLQQQMDSKNWQAELLQPLKQNIIELETQLTTWPKQEIFKALELTQSGIKIKQYPGLDQDRGEIFVALFSSLREAEYSTQQATIGLILTNLNRQLEFMKKDLSQQQTINLGYASLGNYSDFCAELAWAAVSSLLTDKKVSSRTEFESVLQWITGEFQQRATELAKIIVPILEEKVKVKTQLKGKLPVSAIASYQHIARVVDDLIYPGFIKAVPMTQLKCYSNYLKSLLLRLEKLPHNANRERADIETLNHWGDKISTLQLKIPIWSEHYKQLRNLYWMRDELSVSFFTQELGTRIPVSEKRLSKQYNSLIQLLG